MKTLTLTRPDDFHLHLRDGDYLATTVPAVAKQFGRAIIMPNLKPPVTNIDAAKAYKQRIENALLSANTKFTPLMTLYLTDQTTVAEIKAAKQSEIIFGYKLYPAGATTHSASGVTNIEKIYPVLAAMETQDLPLLIHAEVTDADVDIFEREIVFLTHHVTPLLKHFPELRIVIEHVSSADGVAWVKQASPTVAATITAHHLLLNRNDLLVGGIHPHFYCLPIVKSELDRKALIQAATSGNPKFFLGTDSAPHAKSQKETECGCAGIFTGYNALALYAEVFEQAKALDKLEGFASFYGADFYKLPRNQEKITLVNQPWQVPKSLPFGTGVVIPFRADEQMQWQFTETS
jgi:dihydroorotase